MKPLTSQETKILKFEMKKYLDINSAYRNQISNMKKEILKLDEIVERLKNPDTFVEWQKRCVCDFENNNDTHSLTCKSRWEKIC
jgi:hypothetical protein